MDEMAQASVPRTLDEAIGLVRRAELLLLAAVVAGLTALGPTNGASAR